ncbi:MAG: hypothetical protein A3E85_03280 [Gammaproteobacteria bacterium RIFCSPHIGHO2_12_FULL_45_12]|nr:MAG: hypothetical protein A3E85_03280 [Gammaproteobacteria bacterium RIFCSPHIGHO2_12_FULL_45_12]
MRMRKINLDDLKNYLQPYQEQGFLPNVAVPQTKNNLLTHAISTLPLEKLSKVTRNDSLMSNWLDVWGNVWSKFGAST